MTHANYWRSVAFAATFAAAWGAQAQDKIVKIGVLNDQSSLYADLAGRARWSPPRWRSRTPACEKRLEDRDRLRRPPEQARCRHQHRAASGSTSTRSTSSSTCRTRRWRSPSTTSSRKRTRSSSISGAATSDLTGKAVLAQYRALDLRHLHAGQWHRQGAGQGRRRQLVLPHRRLCLRPRARARHRGGRASQWRQGPRRRQASPEHVGLLVVPAAGAVVEGQDHRPRQRRRRHHQLDQAGRSSSASSVAGRTSPVCSCSSPTCTRWASRPRRA